MSRLPGIASPVALRILPIALAMFLAVGPGVSASASAQSRTGTRSQTDTQPPASGEAVDGAVDAPVDSQRDEDSDVPPRGGLGWTGIGLMAAGGLLVAGSFTFNDSKGCGFFNELDCRDVGRVYGVNGGLMLATGLTFLIVDEVRRHPKPYPKRQTAIAIGPRAIQVRMSF